MNLYEYGWNRGWEEDFAGYRDAGFCPGRISCEHRGAFTVMTEEGEIFATISGRLQYEAASRRDMPSVGDWVALNCGDESGRGVIQAVLGRNSSLTRKASGTVAEEQIVASNVDVVFIVSGLDGDFNPRRLERYLTLVYDSGAIPVLVLNKTDLVEDVQSLVDQVGQIAYGVPVIPMSAREHENIQSIKEQLQQGMTGVLIGSSGVGKSSIINALLGEDVLRTTDVREDDSRGRHTTTRRQMFLLPQGGVLIDTPGLREIQLIADESALNKTFEDIAEIAEQCRYRDCSHQGEPGCAVQIAVADGTLPSERYESYHKQQKEINHHRRQGDIHLQIEEKRKWKTIMKSLKHHPKYKK